MLIPLMVSILLALGSTLVPVELSAPHHAGTHGTEDHSSPAPEGEEHAQIITVRASTPDATMATLTAAVRTRYGWRREIGPLPAYVGAQGIGAASESVSRTPAGVWSLTESFGRSPSNGTALPYRQVDDRDWWVSDVNSPHYNQHYRCKPAQCPFDESAGENLGLAGSVYDHATVIDYNRHPVRPGAGSAFFLHITNGRPTAGCVAIARADLDTVMRWLRPSAHPVIDIGIGR